MEHSVVAGCDGVVGEVLVAPGMQVAQGQLLVRVGPEGAGAGEGAGETGKAKAATA